MKRDASIQARVTQVVNTARALSNSYDIARDDLHADRVWRNARIISKYSESIDNWVIDGDVLKLAAYLHVAAPRGSSVEEQVKASAVIAEDLLREHDLERFIWPVGQVILELSPALNREPSRVETKVLRDADRLDALGAIGIARCIASGTVFGAEALYDRADPLAVSRPLDDDRYVLDHFRTSLLHLSDTLYSTYARQEGQRRTRVVRAFYDALLKEAGFMLGSEHE